MDEKAEKTINEINDKLGWAIRSEKRMKANLKNQLELQDNFWSFLAAFQQAWYYFNNFITEKNSNLPIKRRSEVSQNIINSWKENDLTPQEKEAWNILQKLRNSDVHNQPISPNYEILTHQLVTKDGRYITTKDGKSLIVCETENCWVYFEGKEYKIEILTKNGINSIKKLIVFIQEGVF